MASVTAEPKSIRDAVKETFQKLVPETVSVSHIETGIYNRSIRDADERGIVKKWENAHFRNLYESCARSIYVNLDPEGYVGNKGLMNRVVSGEIKPYELAFMRPEEIFPERWQPLLERKSKMDEYKYTKRTEIATDLFRCGKCKERKCTFYQLQTRSADEPMTTFVTCINCGNRWKC